MCDSSCHFEFSLHTFHYLFSTFIHLIFRFCFSSDNCGVFMSNRRNDAILKLGRAKTELPWRDTEISKKSAGPLRSNLSITWATEVILRWFRLLWKAKTQGYKFDFGHFGKFSKMLDGQRQPRPGRGWNHGHGVRNSHLQNFWGRANHGLAVVATTAVVGIHNSKSSSQSQPRPGRGVYHGRGWQPDTSYFRFWGPGVSPFLVFWPKKN